MHAYSVSKLGKEMAEQSGLDGLVRSLAKSDDPRDTLLFDLTHEDWVFHHHRSLVDQESTQREATAIAASHIADLEEMRTLSRGLAIEPATDHWRYLTVNDQLTLFPHPRPEFLEPAISADRFVVSGVVGALLQRYKSQYPLLARSRSAEYGFANHMEACAFAGAYVLGQITSTDSERLKGDAPSFIIPKETQDQEISINGTTHGDFLMGMTRIFNDKVISPADTFVHFSPKETLWVGGYHSVEPDIVAGLILDEFVNRGADGALALISEFQGCIAEYINNRAIDFHTGPFADYGDRSSLGYTLTPLRIVTKKAGATTSLMRRGKLYSAPYLPQSSHLFEMKPIESGMRFQGRDTDGPEPQDGIDIPRSHYPDLFRALVVQAQMGLGRTSPSNIISILDSAKELLSPL